MRRSSTPADLNPLDAAASPIAPDPAVRPKRRGAFSEPALQRLYSEQEAAFLAQGASPEQAAQMAMSAVVQAGRDSITPEDVAAERNAAVASGVALGINDPATMGEPDAIDGPYAEAGRPGYERTFTTGELLAQREQAEAERQAQWAEARNANIEATYGKGARKIAEAADAKGEIDFAAVQSPEEKMNNQYRQDVARSARFDEDTLNRQASRETRAAMQKQQSASNKAFRAQVAAAPKSGNMPSENERWSNYRAQMMLAGSNPRKNMVNAWSMMNDPGVSDQQRRSLQYMLPGGQLTAEVDARANQQAFELAKQMAIGAGFQDTTSPAAQAAIGAKAAAAQEALPPEAAAEQERAANNGVLPATSSAGRRLLKQIDTEYIGPFALTSEIDSAVEAAVAAGVPLAEAEQFFAPRRKSLSEWWGFGKPAAPPAAGVAPGSVPPI